MKAQMNGNVWEHLMWSRPYEAFRPNTEKLMRYNKKEMKKTVIGHWHQAL